MNWKAHLACNFNFVVGNEGLLKVTGRHVCCTGRSISEMVQVKDSFDNRPLTGNVNTMK